MNRTTTISWGTVLSGLIALATAVLVALDHVYDISIPWRTAGPGAVITIGVLFLLAGLLIVFRPRRGESGTPAGVADPPPPVPTDDLPNDDLPTDTVPAAQGAADDSATGVESNGDAGQSNH